MCPRPEPGSVEVSGVQVTRCRPLPRRSHVHLTEPWRDTIISFPRASFWRSTEGDPQLVDFFWTRTWNLSDQASAAPRSFYQLWQKKRRVSEWFTRQETCSRCKHTATALACRYWYVYLSPLASNARAVPPPPFRPIPGAGGTRSMHESLPTPSSTFCVPAICEGRFVPEDNIERAETGVKRPRERKKLSHRYFRREPPLQWIAHLSFSSTAFAYFVGPSSI